MNIVILILLRGNSNKNTATTGRILFINYVYAKLISSIKLKRSVIYSLTDLDATMCNGAV